MKTRIGINGFGRVGRLTFKAINQYHNDKLEVELSMTLLIPKPMPTY